MRLIADPPPPETVKCDECGATLCREDAFKAFSGEWYCGVVCAPANKLLFPYLAQRPGSVH
jgi:hypothetical protein